MYANRKNSNKDALNKRQGKNPLDHTSVPVFDDVNIEHNVRKIDPSDEYHGYEVGFTENLYQWGRKNGPEMYCHN